MGWTTVSFNREDGHDWRGLRSRWEVKKWRQLLETSGSRSFAKKGRKGAVPTGNVRSTKIKIK